MLNGNLEGDPQVMISGPSKIEEGKEGTISFLANPKYEPYAYTTQASVLLVHKNFEPAQSINATLIRVDDVYACVALLLNKFGQASQQASGTADQAKVHPSATIGEAASIGAFTYIDEGAAIGARSVIYPQVFIGKGAKIGEDCIIYPGARIHDQVQIGKGCIIHSNAVIGGDGFGFVPNEEGHYKKIAHIGQVILEDQVEIGANTVIDRATMGATVIRKGSKLDNLVQIAHNVEVGAHTVIAAQAGIAGSTKVGDHCQIGGQAGFVGHIKIANGTRVQAQSGVPSSVEEPNTAIYGSPALPYRNYLQSYAVFKQLPDLYRKISQLEKKIKELES